MGKQINKNKHKKSVTLLVSLILIMLFAASGTLAYIITTTDSISNVFNESYVAVEVTESIDNGVKSDVKVKNVGNTDAYIRAAIVVNWQKEDGTIYGQVPEANDYTISYNLYDAVNNSQALWFKGADGFYYYKAVVAPNESTAQELITSCRLLAANPPAEGYNLAVEIIASGIQSAHVDAVKAAWGEAIAAKLTENNSSKTTSQGGGNL